MLMKQVRIVLNFVLLLRHKVHYSAALSEFWKRRDNALNHSNWKTKQINVENVENRKQRKYIPKCVSMCCECVAINFGGDQPETETVASTNISKFQVIKILWILLGTIEWHILRGLNDFEWSARRMGSKIAENMNYIQFEITAKPVLSAVIAPIVRPNETSALILCCAIWRDWHRNDKRLSVAVKCENQVESLEMFLIMLRLLLCRISD